MVLRPIEARDLDGMYRLAGMVGTGMTNLPEDKQALQKKIEHSLASHAKKIAAGENPDSETYLFVLEDTENQQIVGCSGIFASVGLDRPFYSYRVLELPHVSPELGIYKSVPALHMVNQYTGEAEVGVLFLEKDYRKNGNGRLLAKARYLFMAEFRNRFPDGVIAEMRGSQYAEGQSAFWDAIGSHFFDMNFQEADSYSVNSTQFIADLMPKHPIYICTLPIAAQEVIGVAHQDSKPALELLKQEGFRYEGGVDVFDAGPQVFCALDQIATVRDSKKAIIKKLDTPKNSVDVFLSNTKLESFRLARGLIEEQKDGDIILEPALAKALKLNIGDAVRYVHNIRRNNK